MGRVLLLVLGLLALALIVFVWLGVRTLRAGSRRDHAVMDLLAPVVHAVNAGREPSSDVLERFAANPLTRGRLHDVLERAGRSDLFPERHRTAAALAESDLAYWLAHPNELGRSPEHIELMGTVKRAKGGAVAEYFVFRFRTDPPHWAAGDGWLAGIAGPHPAGGPPPTLAADTFSRFEPFEKRSLEEHVTACLDPSAVQALQVGHAKARAGEREA